MKRMSESLTELAARAKKVEDSAAAAREESREKLQARRQEIDEAFDKQVKKFETASAEAGEKVRQWRTDSKASVERRIEAMRAAFQARKAEFKADKAQWAADDAEEEAVATIDIAIYWLEAAEYAVVQAVLARAEADNLAGVK